MVDVLVARKAARRAQVANFMSDGRRVGAVLRRLVTRVAVVLLKVLGRRSVGGSVAMAERAALDVATPVGHEIGVGPSGIRLVA
jgi:hypothetical protein